MTRTYAIDARTVDKRFPGIGRYVSNLLRAIVPHLHANERVVYLCSAGQRAELGLPDNEIMSWLDAAASPFEPAQQWQIPRLLRARDVDVYHSPYYLMPYWPGMSTVLTVYDLIPMLFPKHVSIQARLFFRLTTSLALRRARHVLAISQATRTDYLSRFNLSPDRITTTHLAASSDFHPAAAERVTETRRAYDLAGPFVLYVGSNKPHKNLVRLVQAWAQIPETVRERHTLVLAGRHDPRYSEVEQEVERLGLAHRVRQLQDVTDGALPALYSGAEIFVFPSLYEGFGLPVLEAMACGAAIACSNRSSLPEIVAESALLFDPRQPEAISRAIFTLLEDRERRAELGRKALERSAAFSWDKTAAATIAVYRNA